MDIKVKDLFERDINRNINGVIQAGQLDEASIYNELDEYVVTEELTTNLEIFYRNYVDGLSEPTSKMGVWISGYFGCGKSHLLKIQSYLLNNCTVKGKKAVEFFLEKDMQPDLLKLIIAAAEVDCDALLFNIDSKSSTGPKNEKQKIVEVFLKVFNEHLGFSSTVWIAEIERQLEQEGQYESFKAAFASENGKPWEADREYVLVKQKVFISAMQTIGFEEETARSFLKGIKATYEISSESLAKLIAQYCRNRGKGYRMVFLVDEIGQYIGDNRELMLNLQTVTEDLGNYANGQVWVIVTSQEKIDAVTKVRSEDFSKIQGRFATRINLSSTNTDEVIKRRLLAKEVWAEQTLQLKFTAGEQSLRNMLSFDSKTGALRSGYKSAEEFTACYPFIPYQFELLQKVFDRIRKQGEAGKHLSHAERSLLNSFQEVAVLLGNSDIDCLANFALFYGTLEKFLDPSVKSTILKAKHRDGIASFDLEVLQALYMIKGIEGFPANLTNLTTLLIDSVETIKNETERRVNDSLQKLTHYVLIQCNADQTYTFLSDEEQEINQEIKNTPIDSNKVVQDMSRVFFGDVYGRTRYRYLNKYDFDFNRRFDGYPPGITQHPLTLQVYSEPISDAEARLQANYGILIMRLPEDGTNFVDYFEYPAKINEYLNRTSQVNLPKDKKRILEDKRRDIGDFEEKGRYALKEASSGATFYIEGQSYTYNNGEVSSQIDRAFEILVRNTFTKLDYIDHKLEVKNAAQQIKDWSEIGIQQKIDGNLPNQLAIDEVERFLENPQSKTHRPTVKVLAEHFSKIPYGWTDWDMAGILTLLMREGKVKLSYLGERFNTANANYVQRLTKPAEREKVIVELEVAIPPEVRKRLAGIMREHFGQHVLGDTYESVAVILREKIRDHMSEPLRKIQQRRKSEVADFPYPGLSVILKLEAVPEALLARHEDEQLVLELFDLEDQLEEWFIKLEDMEDFYLGKSIDHFDRAVQVLSQRKTDLDSTVEHIDLQAVKRQIETVLRMADAYKQIVQLPQLIHRLEEGLQKVLAEEREKYFPELDSVQMEVAEMTEQYSSDARITAIIVQGQDSINKQINQYRETDSITQLIAVPTLAKRALEQLKKQVKAAVPIVKPTIPIEDEVPISRPDGKRVKKVVSWKELISQVLPEQEVQIENDGQLQQMIDALQSSMREIIKDHVLVIRK